MLNLLFNLLSAPYLKSLKKRYKKSRLKRGFKENLKESKF